MEHLTLFIILHRGRLSVYTEKAMNQFQRLDILKLFFCVDIIHKRIFKSAQQGIRLRTSISR